MPDSFNGELQKDWFNIDNISLKTLYLRFFNVTKFTVDAFESKQFVGLIELVIDCMKEITLVSGCFNGLSNLRKLELTSIRIYQFEAHVLASVPNLQSLYIHCIGNRTLILDNLLGTTEMYQLIQVRVRNCNLTDTITEKTFSGLKSVIELNLYKNHIEQLDKRSLDVVLQTTHFLHLTFNKLTSLPIELFENRRENFLQVIAHSNPWHCDSTMEKLHKFIHSNPNIQFSPIVCKTPPKCEQFHVETSEVFCKWREVNVTELVKEEIVVSMPKEVVQKQEQKKQENPQQNELISMTVPTETVESNILQCEINQNNRKMSLLKRTLQKLPTIRKNKNEFEVDASGASSDYQLIAIDETSNLNRRFL